MKRKNKKNSSRINKILEFPEEISSNDPKITILGFGKIMIENYKGILEYESYYIKLKTSLGLLNINGFNLFLNEMTDEDLIITGKIESIEFESVTDKEE